MSVNWASDDGGFHSAKYSLGSRGVVRLAVERLGAVGWNWHVWNRSGEARQHYGFADTLAEAKEQAELALDVMAA